MSESIRMTDRIDPASFEHLFLDPDNRNSRLQTGMSGVACRNIRLALRQLGYRMAEGDVYDAHVANAVLQFQIDNNHVNQDGICGRRTQLLLVSSLLSRIGARAFSGMESPRRSGRQASRDREDGPIALGVAHPASVPVPSPKVFISYRRDDNPHVTARIYERLVGRFGAENVFMDIDSIPYGVDFRAVLQNAIARCDVCLAVIGTQWAGPRLNNAGDFVRSEVETALTKGIPVIPVFVHPAGPDDLQCLPPSLSDLLFRNGLVIHPDPQFHPDVDRLIRAMDQLGSSR